MASCNLLLLESGLSVRGKFNSSTSCAEGSLPHDNRRKLTEQHSSPCQFHPTFSFCFSSFSYARLCFAMLLSIESSQTLSQVNARFDIPSIDCCYSLTHPIGLRYHRSIFITINYITILVLLFGLICYILFTKEESSQVVIRIF